MAQSNKTEQTKNNHHYHFGLSVGLAILAALLLMVANSAFWFNKYIFDQDNFTSLTTSAVEQESSRQAIATELSSKIFANRPVLARVAEEPVTKIITGALGSNIAQKVFTKAVDSLHTIATSANPQDVSLDLVPVKQVVANLALAFDNQATPGEAAIKVQDLPDTITIVDASKVPNIYNMGVVLLWVAPFAAVISLVLFGYNIFIARRSWHDIASVLAIYALVVAVVGGIALLIGPLFKPLVLSNVQSSNMQVVVGNIYTAFVATFDKQSGWLFFGAAVVMILVAAGIWVSKPINNWIQSKKHS